MELTWDARARAWVSDVSRAGPAGTAAITVGGVWVAFDRVDGGRIVSLSVPVRSAAQVLLGDVSWNLRPPDDVIVGKPSLPDGEYELECESDDVPVAEISINDSPLWHANRELALAAQLAEDVAQLEGSDPNAAAVAYAELGQLWEDLGKLAPGVPHSALERLLALRPRLDAGGLNLYEDGRERYARIMERILEWAPPTMRGELGELVHPVAVPKEIRVTIGRESRARFAALADNNSMAGENVLGLVQRANELGRTALRLEQSDPAEAAGAWRLCASAWRAIGETGRAAIALDRAADTGREFDAAQADADREDAARIGPAWTVPMLGGRTGTPNRPLWNLAYGIASLASLRTEPSRRPGGTLATSVNLQPMPAQAYVFISSANAPEDQAYVRRLATELEKAGIQSWYDRHVDPGQRWDREVAARLSGCAAFIVVMSAHGESSPWVQWELDRATALGRPIHPILLSGTGFASLANTRYGTVPPGHVMPSGAFLDRLRNDVAAATRPNRVRSSVLVGRGFPPANPVFLGRERVLSDIEERLSARDRIAVRAARGSSGIGKSQLAAEYAYGHRTDYDLIAWIDAARPELIADQVADLAPQLGLPPGKTTLTTARQAVDALSSTDLRWLVIFNNAEQHDLGQWLPRASNGHVIVTSRQTVWDVPTFEVDVIGRDESVELLRQRTFSAVDDRTAGGIVDLLGGLPLALEQAAGHIATADIPPSDYLRLLRDRSGELVEDRVAEDLRSVATVWDVGRPSLRATSHAAEQLLEVSSFLGPEPIPFDLFSQNPASLPGPLAEAASDPTVFLETVNELVRRGFARTSGETLSIHRLLARSVRRPLSGPTQSKYASTVRELLVRHLPDEVEQRPNTLSMWRALMPHVLSATDPGPRPDDPGRTSWLLARAGHYLRAEGEAGARQLLARAVRVDERANGPNHPFVARRLSSLALTLKDFSQRPEEARPLLERALSIDEAAFGPDHPQVASDLRSLAAVLTDLGQIVAAKPLLERALHIDEATHGPNAPELAASLNDLAAVLNALGRDEEAQRLTNRAVNIDKSDRQDWK